MSLEKLLKPRDKQELDWLVHSMWMVGELGKSNPFYQELVTKANKLYDKGYNVNVYALIGNLYIRGIYR